MKSYYDYFGISPQAKNDDIKKAFKELTKKWHPDTYKGKLSKEDVNEAFSFIKEIYDVLMDTQKRETYDKYLAEQYRIEHLIRKQGESLSNIHCSRIQHVESLKKIDEDEELIRIQLKSLQDRFSANIQILKNQLCQIDKQFLQKNNSEEVSIVPSEPKLHDDEGVLSPKGHAQKANTHNTPREEIPPRNPSRKEGLNLDKVRCAAMVNLEGETELHIAIKFKDLKQIISLNLNGYLLRVNNKKQNFIHYIAKYIDLDFLNENERKCIDNLIITNNTILNIQDNNGNTPLHIAVKCFKWKLAHFFLNNNGNVNTVNNKKQNILLLMVKNFLSNQVIVMQFFDNVLQATPDINVRDVLGNTALHYAVANNNIYAVKSLLMRGADINIQNEEGNTPLHYAVCYGNVYATSELLNRKANIVANTRGEVPLHNAITVLDDLKPADIQAQQNVISCLLKASVQQVWCTDCNGRTPLHYAVSNEILNSAVINLLLENNAPVNSPDKDGNSPFHILLTRERCADFSATFLAKGADIYLTNKQNKSPLLLLIENSDSEDILNLSKLLNLKTETVIDLNKIYCDNKSLLYSALLWGDHSLAKLLMEKGALLNKEDGKPHEILTKLRNNASSKEIIDLVEQAIKLSFISEMSEKASQKRPRSSDEVPDPSKRECKESPNSIVNPAAVSSTMFNGSVTIEVDMQLAPDCNVSDSKLQMR